MLNIAAHLRTDLGELGAVSGEDYLGISRAASALPRRGAYALYNLVTLLQEKVPPHTRPIDISDHDWLRDVWAEVFDQLAELREGHSALAELMDHVCAIVVNYDSQSLPGLYGGRHTASLINLRRLRGRAKRRVEGITPLVGQNHVFFYEGRALARSRRQKTSASDARAFWLDNWLQYILLDNGPDERVERDPAAFTLNNMLLRRAVHPRPALITWGDAPPPAERMHALTPMALHVPRPESWPEVRIEELDRFVSEFAAMFDVDESLGHRDRNGRDWTINRVSVHRMLHSLMRHFGSIGGNAFLTIPVMLRVNPTRGDAAEPRAELRAAVSVLLEVPADWQLMETGWLFFDGIASRILTSLLASEFMAFAHQRWEIERADSINLASHPIKHKSRPAMAAQNAISAKVAQLLAQIESGDEAGLLRETYQLVPELAAHCALAKNNLQILDGIANLMSLLLELGPEMRASIEATLAGSGATDLATIDLFQWLVEAEREVVDKVLGDVSVKLEFAGSPKLLIQQRFAAARLERHAELEPVLYKAIFAELLQNAANNGVNPADRDSLVIPVQVEFGHQVMLRNFLAAEDGPMAVRKAREISSDDPLERFSSGLYFVKKVFSTLCLGKLYARCYPNGITFPDVDPEMFVWEYLIDLSGRQDHV